MYVACIYDPRPLTLMHICMMHISMILDPNEYLPDGRTDGRTDKPILGVGLDEISQLDSEY